MIRSIPGLKCYIVKIDSYVRNTSKVQLSSAILSPWFKEQGTLAGLKGIERTLYTSAHAKATQMHPNHPTVSDGTLHVVAVEKIYCLSTRVDCCSFIPRRMMCHTTHR